MRQIAGFIGSDAFTNDELCCLVGMPEEFMGSHTVKGRGEKGSAASSKLSSRFGHWRAKLEGKAALSEAMHKEGARGLNLFGYQSDGSHPAPAPALDGYVRTNAGGLQGQGHRRPAGGIGSGKKELKSPGRKPPGSYFVPPDSPTCGFAHDTDYKGGGHDITMGDEADAAGCCERCRKTSGCSYFTFVPEQRLCYLKRGTAASSTCLGSSRARRLARSGARGRAEELQHGIGPRVVSEWEWGGFVGRETARATPSRNRRGPALFFPEI